MIVMNEATVRRLRENAIYTTVYFLGAESLTILLKLEKQLPRIN